MSAPFEEYDEVRFTTDRFGDEGAPLGSIGFIIEIWEPGVFEVEVPDKKTGENLASVVANAADLERVDPPPTRHAGQDL